MYMQIGDEYSYEIALQLYGSLEYCPGETVTAELYLWLAKPIQAKSVAVGNCIILYTPQWIIIILSCLFIYLSAGVGSIPRIRENIQWSRWI